MSHTMIQTIMCYKYRLRVGPYVSSDVLAKRRYAQVGIARSTCYTVFDTKLMDPCWGAICSP